MKFWVYLNNMIYLELKLKHISKWDKSIKKRKTTDNEHKLKAIYDKLAIVYLNQDKIDLCKKYLLLSKDLI